MTIEFMQARYRIRLIPAALLLVICVAGYAVLGQQEPAKPQSPDDVVRTDTDLVQTAVTVLTTYSVLHSRAFPGTTARVAALDRE